MQILVSPVSIAEAESLADTDVDILDVKNVAEGSLGAQAPWITQQVSELARRCGKRSSAAIGDLPFLPGAAALAAFGAAATGVDFVKAGLYGVSSRADAQVMLTSICCAVKSLNPAAAVVACGYADFADFGGLPPDRLVAAAAEARCELVMLDTASKRHSLFDCQQFDELQAFVAAARQRGLGVALAGSLAVDHVDVLCQLAPDLIGIRGAVCQSDRSGPICPEKVRAFVQRVRGVGVLGD